MSEKKIGSTLLCVGSCRSGAIHLNGFDEGQIMAILIR